MANGDGVNGTFKILGWIGGAIAFLITIYTVFHVPMVDAIDKERDCRIEGDAEIRQEVARKLDKISEQNMRTATILAELRSDMRYIKGASRECNP